MDAFVAFARPTQQVLGGNFAVVIPIALALLYATYRWALPKPLPGIPHNERATLSMLGDLPEIVSHIKKTGLIRPWFSTLNERMGTSLVQIWPTPLAKPVLVLSDYQESQDILMRRTKEFDRASRTLEAFAGVVPNHQISLRTHDPRFKGNKEFVRDLMSPTFLREISAPQIYARCLNLIELWTLKAEAAGGKPFSARQDLLDMSMDMINAAAFGFDDRLYLLRHQINHLRALDPATRAVDHGDLVVEFPRPPAVDDIATFQIVIQYLGQQLNEPLPSLVHMYNMATDSGLRSAIRRKDQIVVAQIHKSAHKLAKGDSTQVSAVDYVVQREISVAKKEGRNVNFTSKRMIDEVCFVPPHAKSLPLLNFTVVSVIQLPRR
jgi:hypothetical protein